MTDDNKNELCIWKPIAIPLCGFDYVHSPYNETVNDALYLFAGRDTIINRLVSLIKSTKRWRGSYLIAGYRGVGKTSIVNRAIEKYKISNNSLKSRDPIVVKINLGDNSKLTPFDIYFSITNFLIDELHPPYKYYAVNKMLVELRERMSHEISESRSIGTEISATNQAFFKIVGSIAKGKKTYPMTVRDAEDRLLKILKKLTTSKKRKVIFIFDEIDKLSHAEVATDLGLEEIEQKGLYNDAQLDKNTKINTLLGALKNFITTANGIFFFISGRETLDRYYSEKGSTNSLYESLFDQVFEVPSLLTDKRNPQRDFQLTLLVEEYLCRRLMKIKNINEVTFIDRLKHFFVKSEKEESKPSDDYYTLNNYHKLFLEKNDNNHADGRMLSSLMRNFIYYLTFHSWGNPKRLSAIFESFIISAKPDEQETKLITCEEVAAEYWLYFDISHLRAFALAAELTTLFQHQFSREVSRISDKLTVTSLASLQFILKHHSYGFSRESLHHMSEAMNVHRSPAFNTIVDDLLTQTFKSYIRRVRNGVYRYRFHSGFEQELRYISHTAELESAAYTFSLDSMRQVKQLFKNILTNTNVEEKGIMWESLISLGDICALEQSYNEASTHYCAAIRLLNQEVNDSKTKINLETLITYVEVMMKYGDLEEHRQNYASAVAIYSDATCIIERSMEVDNGYLEILLKNGDSKWDMLKQPIWAMKYLSLKRSPRRDRKLEELYKYYDKNDKRMYFRIATLAYFLGDFDSATNWYERTVELASEDKESHRLYERNAYLKGNSLVGLVETYLASQAQSLFIDQLAETTNIKPKYLKSLSQILCAQFPALTASVKTSDPIPSSNIVEMLYKAATLFEDNRIYISAAFTHMKTIAYLSSILDAFDAKSPAELCDFLTEFRERVIKIGKDAIRCINKARQLESSQSNKTLLAYNFTEDDCKIEANNQYITKLFDLLLDWSQPVTQELLPKSLLKEQVYWQQSLWAHKLAATLVWARFVYLKVTGNQNVSLYMPSETSTLSVRPAIILRWLYARDVSRQYIDGKLVEAKKVDNDGTENITPCHRPIEIFENCNCGIPQYSLTESGREFTDFILKFTKKQNGEEHNWPHVLKKAYSVSRNLYFALSAIRIISRRNMDLIFPRLSQIFFTQWKLLVNLATALIVDKEYIEKNTSIKIDSVRTISFLLQRIFLEMDKCEATHEGIPPSQFDYEYIHLRLCESLDSSVSMIDETSRARTGIFHNKYYCHDDYTDAEFRMDYTLAYMFIPSAVFLRNYVKNTHTEFEKALRCGKERVGPS